MHIVVDATPLLLRSAGVKNYVHHWISHMRRVSGPHSIATFPVRIPLDRLDHERSEAGPVATLAGLSVLHFLDKSRLPWRYPGADVFHASHQFRNPPKNAKLTATIYDMTCWLTPGMHSRRNVKGSLQFGESVLKRADGLIAISESSRRDALEILGLKPERVEVVYPGIAEAFFEAKPDDARRKYNLEKPYALFVGTVEPRKNIDTLLDAYNGLSPSLRDEFELVVAGPSGWAAQTTFDKLRRPGIRHLGYIPEADLPGITAGATVFAYPSFYEGFGFPVAQAMAAGVPVVTSNVSSLPEIAAGAALLVDPRSEAEVRSALDKLLSSPTLGAELGAAGRVRAQQYRWETAARKSLAFFERICNAV
jgi:glycosyltransferase involved in cell wall biosynthesis